MATPAYSELYLSDAMKTLAHFVDYSIHECGFDPDELVLHGINQRHVAYFLEAIPG